MGFYKSSYGSDVPSQTYLSPPPSQNVYNYLTPSPELGTSFMDAPLPSCLARDAIYGWPRVRTWDVELNLTKNLDYFILQVFVTYVIRYSCNLQVVSSSILFEMIPINLVWHEITFKIIYFHA